MKYFFVLLIPLSISARAQVCGLYQVEDFGDRVLYSITRFTLATPITPSIQTVFTLTNPGHPTVRNMIHGMCYCVDGVVRPDPEFEGDDGYQLLTLSHLEGPPYIGCIPGDISATSSRR